MCLNSVQQPGELKIIQYLGEVSAALHFISGTNGLNAGECSIGKAIDRSCTIVLEYHPRLDEQRLVLIDVDGDVGSLCTVGDRALEPDTVPCGCRQRSNLELQSQMRDHILPWV